MEKEVGMRYKVGDLVDFNGMTGRIEKALINNKIGFTEEKNREPVYTIVFDNIPESEIISKDGSISTTDTEESSQEEGKSTER